MDSQDYRELLKAVAYEQAKLSTSAFFLDGQDRIRIRSFGSVTSCVLAIEARVLDAQGDCVGQAAVHTPNTDRSVATTTLEFGDGFLLNIQVRATASTPRVGQVYVILDLVRGQGATIQPIATLWCGYVTDTTPAGWPGIPSKFSTEGPGVLRAIVGADPAAGAEVSETVPTNARWQLFSLTAALVTDGTVANRLPALVFDDGANVYGRYPVRNNEAASGTYANSWGQGIAAAAELNAVAIGAGLPVNLRLQGGHRIRTITAAIVAGDNWGPPTYLVEEWIED